MNIPCRHGDVIVLAQESMPNTEGLVKLEHKMLAEGEVTGHHHSVKALDLNEKYLWIERGPGNSKERAFISGEELLKKYPGVDFQGGTAAPVLFQDPANGEIHFQCPVTTVLTHQEHGSVVLGVGCYKSKIQREYHPDAIRNVRD